MTALLLPATNPDTDLRDLITSLATDFINRPLKTLDGGITEALGRIGEFAGVDRAYVFTVDAAAGLMSNTHEWCAPGVAPQMENLQNIPVEAYDWCMSRILAGEVLHIPRVSDLPATQPDRELLQAEDIQSLLAVPIMSAKRVLGLVGFDAVRREKVWTGDAITLLKIVGTIFGNAFERRRAEETLLKEKQFVSAVLDAEGSLLLVFAPDGYCIRVNRAVTELTGLTVDDLNAGRWRRMIPERFHAMVRVALRRTLLGGRAEIETPVEAPDGAAHDILWTARLVRSPQGMAENIVVAGADLTEMRVLRAQVEQARRLDSLGRVAATIAHEFNNVLMSMYPPTEMIRRSPEQTDKVLRAAERIARAIKRGEVVTRSVARFARPAEIDREMLDAIRWTRGLVEEMRGLIATRTTADIEIVLVERADELSVRADPNQLHLVFTNLILNAVDALPQGGRITVALEEVESDPRLPAPSSDGIRWIHWTVSDTGTGIPPAVLEHIFEPLFTTKKKGTGLGLAVAHQIITAHGGVLSVETSVGSGTTFHVFLSSEARQ